jgi:hypothetical protein
MSYTNNIAIQEFQQVHGIISLHRTRALQTVNNENLLTAWEIGAYVSARLKNAAWGSKTVMQLSEYLRAQDPTLRGYSRRNIYNNEFVQPMAAQLGEEQYPLQVGNATFKVDLLFFHRGEVLQHSLEEFTRFLIAKK